MSADFTDEVRAYLSTQQARKLFGVVFHSYQCKLDADDLMQDMAVRCLEQSHHFRGGNVEAWVRTVASRVVLNELRKPRNTRIHYEYEERTKVDSAFARSDNKYDRPDALAEAMDLARELWDGAKPEEQIVLRALLVNEGSGSKVAKALGRNKHTMNASRRRQKMRFKALQGG
jgi:RNA polymerase sigma factor (sigma-70 family)